MSYISCMDCSLKQWLSTDYYYIEQVKQLSGFLPICCGCKKIRDDEGYWKQIESYISKHSEAEFSHGICPECTIKLYPDLVDSDGNFK